MEMQFFKKLFAQNKSKRKSVSRFSRTVRFEPLENRELLTASPSDAPINVETYSQQYLEDGVFTCNGTLTFSFGGSETSNQADEMTFSAGSVSIKAIPTGLCVNGQGEPLSTVVVNVQAGDSFTAPPGNIQIKGGPFGVYGLEDWTDNDYNDLVVNVSFLPDYVSDPDPESDPKCDCTCGADGVTQNAAGWKDPSNNISRPADFYNTLNLKAESALPQNALNEFPVSVKATYTLNNSITQDVYYTVGSFDPTEKFTTAAQLDTSSLSSGRYDWTIELLYTYADNTTSNETFTGQTSIVNLSDSPYGAGVNLTGLSHLNFSDWDNQVGSGINWERSCGKKVWFTWDGTDFIAEDGESVNSTLTPNLNGYTIIDHNERFTFNSAGQLTLREGLTDGALTMWAYNADGTAYSKTDESGRVTTYSYSNGLLSSVTDFAGRTTTYTYDQYNRLTSITQPAADNQSLPQTTSFTYDGTSNRILTQTDPDGTVTAYAYQNGVLTSITRNGITEMQQSAFVSQALPDLSVEGYDAAHPAQLVSQQDGQGEYVNKYGVTTSYVLDANNNVVYQNTNGIEIFSTYDSNGLLLQRTENNSNTLHVDYRQTLYEYDARGNLTLVTYPDGSTERWTYDGTFDQVTSYTDPLGNRTIYTVDSVTGLTTSARQVVGEVDDLQNGETDDVVTLYAYNADKRLVSVTDALGFVTAYTYDARGNVLTETTAYGTALAAATLYTYDSADRLTSSTDPLGRTTNYQYDALDRLVQTTLPAAQTGADRLTTQSVYNNLGQLVQSTDVNGAVTVYTYNAAGQLASVATGASTSTYAYNAYGDLLTVTDSLGSVTRYEYNANGKLIATYAEDGLGASVQTSATTYDAWGRTATETNAAGVTLSYAYDKMDRVVKITRLNDNVVLETRTYDAAGNLKTVKDALNHTTTYTYDALGNLTQIVNPDGSATQYAYDKLGRIVSTTDALGNTTAYTYDANGNQTSATDAEGNTTSYTYDAAGQLVSSADPSGSVATYAYDGLGRNTSVTLSNINNTESVTTSTVYSIQTIDSVRYNVVTQYDALGNATVSTYDVYGDLLSVQQGTAVTTYNYNSEGQLISQTDALNHTTQYAYDYLGNLASVTAADNTVTTYNYNAAGQLISQTDALGTITQYSYDYLGNVVSTVVINNTGSLAPSSDNLYPISSWLDESQTFNGTSDKVVIGNPAELNFTGEITLSATVKIDSFNGFQDILAHGYTFSPAGEVFLRLNGNLIQVGSYNGPTYGATALLDASDLGQWITFTGTYDGENWNLYKDGVLIVSTPSAVGAVTVNADWVIGASAQNDRFFKGEIKDVAIWDSALSAEEIQLYRQYGPCQYAALNKSTYNAVGWLTSSTDAEGNTASYTYDSMGRVLTVTDALENTTSYTYDLLGRVFEQTTPQGTVTRYTYDAVGNVLKTEQYDSSEIALPAASWLDTAQTFNGTSDKVVIGNPADLNFTGEITLTATVKIDSFNGLQDILAHGYTFTPDGEVFLRLLDNQIQVGSFNGMTYCASANLDASDLGQWITFTGTYDGTNWNLYKDGVLIASTASSIGAVTVNADWVIGASAQNNRFFDGEIKDVAIYRSALTATQVAALYNGTLDNNVITTTYTYTPAGAVASITDPEGNTTSYQYDYRGLQTSITDPLGNAITTAYNANGQPVSQTDALNNTTSYTYNSYGKVLTVTDAESNVTSYSYNLLGQMTSLTDPEGNATSWTYDSMGRVVSETNEKNAIRAYEYDDLGRLIQTTDRNGRVIQYEYDYLGRQTAEKWLDSNNAVIGSIEYTFDGNNNLLTVTDSISGTNYEYQYDALNRCIYTCIDAAELNSPVYLSYLYNDSDLTVTETLTGLINGVVAPYYQNVYQYDVFGRLESISQTGTGLTAKSIEYFYNKLGQRTGATYKQNGGTVSESAWLYDVAGKISSIQHKTASDAVFADYGFTWDAGNRITEFETVDGTAEYTYDKTGQLTGADYDYITDELYTYDDNGNRTNAGYVTGENNETLSDGVYRYSYDNEGNRTEKFLWTDSNNNGIIDASEKTLVQTYEWDYRNRLSSVTNYENGIAKEVIDYLYDYLNLMIERTVTDAATSILQSSDFNIYSNGQVVLEYDTTSSVDVVKTVNLWGANIDELAAVEQIAQSVNDSNVILWAYGDHLNSIRDIVLYDSIAQTAAIVNHLIYNAFGILVSSTDGAANPASISPLLNYRYTGKFFDDSTGLQNNINRWYDNTIGKWISVDPIGFKGGDSNLYRYARNTTMFLDHNGLFTQEDWNAIDNMSEYEFRMFLDRHPFDPDYADIKYYYYRVIQPLNEIKYQIDLLQKKLSENPFDKPYWFINDEILEIERERFGIHEWFLNNSFNDSSNIVNSPYLRNANPQVGIPSVPYAVNPYGGFGSNNSNHNPDSNSEGSAPHSINDFNWSINFDRQKYFTNTSPNIISVPQISLSSDNFSKDYITKLHVDNYTNNDSLNKWKWEYGIDSSPLSILEKKDSFQHFASTFDSYDNKCMTNFEVRRWGLRPDYNNGFGFKSNIYIRFHRIDIQIDMNFYYLPEITPFDLWFFHYNGNREQYQFFFNLKGLW